MDAGSSTAPVCEDCNGEGSYSVHDDRSVVCDRCNGEGVRLVQVAALLVEIRDAVRAQSGAEAVARLLSADPHQFSTRGCQTCSVVSALLGKPFGCVAMAKEHKHGRG